MKMSAPYTELDKPLDEYAMICRGCLAESGEMKNIFEWGLADDFCKSTDIKLTRSEQLSELLCTACEEALQASCSFRMQCQRSELLLQSAVKKPQQTEECTQQTGENTISCVIFDKKLVFMITAPNADTKIYLTCPNCQISYIKQKDLLQHMIKTHLTDKDTIIELQYYCSDINCSYHINSGHSKFFQGRKFLNQHYNKVHSSKIFNCDICSQSFAKITDFNRHLHTCNVAYLCQVCNVTYKTNEKLLVHLMRKHPDLHKQYKDEKKALKRSSQTAIEAKKSKFETEKLEYICNSPKRSSSTQTSLENIKNDVTLPSWQSKPDSYEAKTDEISTQTVFEDLLSLKSQTSEDESIFFSETVSLSDIQTQTFPIEFGLSRSNKETITSETQSPDLSIKETQTCFCLYDSPKMNFRLFDSVSSSPSSINLTSTETQTPDVRCAVKSDVMLSFNSAETQTSFDDGRENL